MRAPTDRSPVHRRATAAFVVFALTSWSWAAWRGTARPEPDLYPFLKRVWPGASYERSGAGGFAVSARGGEALGRAAVATASGYGGPVSVALALSPAGAVIAAAILEYRDTPDLLRTTRGLVAALVGKHAGDPFRIGEDLDAVTGATFSSQGLAAAARQAAATGGGGAATGEAARARPGAPEAALVALFALAGWGRHRRKLAPRRRTALRTATLALGLLVLGLLYDRPWVIAFPLRLAAGDLPPLSSHLYWYLLLAALLVVFARDGRGPWCPWICPFGAAQDLAGRLGGAWRHRPARRPAFVWVKRGLLWLAVFLGLAERSPGAASFEVFGTLFRAQGSGFQWALLVLVLVTALFVARPFCHWVCPVDPLERALAAARARLLGRPRRAPRRGSPALPVLRAAGPEGTVRRWRDGLLVAVGGVCALLVVGHLATRFSRLAAGPQLGLLGETFVARAAEPR